MAIPTKSKPMSTNVASLPGINDWWSSSVRAYIVARRMGMTNSLVLLWGGRVVILTALQIRKCKTA